MDSNRNPADDLTRGKTLKDLSVINRWSQGPSFLLEPEPAWPITPAIQPPEDRAEHRKGIFCGISTEVMVLSLPDPVTYSSWKELVEATVQNLKEQEQPSAADYVAAESLIFQKSQIDSFQTSTDYSRLGRLYSQPVGYSPLHQNLTNPVSSSGLVAVYVGQRDWSHQQSTP